jgi:hypothetical protein
MKLCGISENDVKLIIDQGEREILSGGRISFIHDAGGKFKYPIKVVGIQEGASL